MGASPCRREVHVVLIAPGGLRFGELYQHEEICGTSGRFEVSLVAQPLVCIDEYPHVFPMGTVVKRVERRVILVSVM